MKKYTFILSVILISLLAVGAVSASDSDNFTNDVISSVKDSNINDQIVVDEINDLEDKSLATEIGTIEENITDDINNQSTENGVNGIDLKILIPTKSNQFRPKLMLIMSLVLNKMLLF